MAWDIELRGLRFDLNLGSKHKVQDTLTTVLVNTQEVVTMSDINEKFVCLYLR